MNSNAAPRLTSLSHGAGCGCKIPAARLAQVLDGFFPSLDDRVLVGPGTADDAGVFLLRDDLALVQTVDFFTPIVDDPFAFGQIAAANAISDIYAMGAEPLTALSLVAFPLDVLGPDILREILDGGAACAREAGVHIIGGHSIDDPEPKFGMAVTGVVNPAEVLTNAGAQRGDILLLTKPLGVGAITTAAKRNEATDEMIGQATAVMATLNADAARAARAARAHAVTDVTGFGLLGHLHELAAASGLAAEITAASVPVLDGVRGLLERGTGISGGMKRNREHAQTFTTFDAGVTEADRCLLSDPTTSGGLLVAVDPHTMDGDFPGDVFGRLVAGGAGSIHVS